MPFIVTFSVEEPSRRSEVVGGIKALGDWAELNAHAYYFVGDAKAGETMESLQPMLGPNDNLWVFTVCNPWAGYGNVLADGDVAATLGPDEDWIPRDWDEVTRSRP